VSDVDTKPYTDRGGFLAGLLSTLWDPGCIGRRLHCGDTAGYRSDRCAIVDTEGGCVYGCKAMRWDEMWFETAGSAGTSDERSVAGRGKF